MQKKIIYLPMETKVREYHAKLLFTIYAIQRGYQVLFGSRGKTHNALEKMPPGIYFGKHATNNSGKIYQQRQSLGHKIVANDEEGLVYYNPDIFKQHRIGENTIRSISHFFTWGEHHSSLVCEKDSELTNYSAVGNMRFELLKLKYRDFYEKRVKELKQEYGDYILFNTNFGRYNSLADKEVVYESIKKIMVEFSDEDRSTYEAIYGFQEENFKSFQSLIAYLAPKVMPTKIIIRPHPSENLESWECMRASNVFIKQQGNVIPWILAAKALVHHSCTTAIESVFLGTPVIRYSPIQNSRALGNIVSKVGKTCLNEEEVATALTQLELWHTQEMSDTSCLEHYVSNMHPEENAAYAMLDVIDNIDIPAAPISEILQYQKRLSNLRNNVRKIINTILGKQSSKLTVQRQKFPGLGKKELLRDLRLMSHAIGIDPSTIATTKLSESFFHITAK